MKKSLALSLISLAIISLNSTVFAGSDDEGTIPTIASQPNWKLHLADLEAAAYAEEHKRSRLVSTLDNIKGDCEAPTSNYMGLLWKIAHTSNPNGRAILFKELELLTYAHYVWHAWGFTKEKSMEHQAAEKGQKTEWILRRPQEMRTARKLNSLYQSPNMKFIEDEARKTARNDHEDFKVKLSDGLKPIQPLLESHKDLIPTEFSDFWKKIQDTNIMKHAERLIANSIAADDPNHSAAKPPESDESDILGRLWEVYNSVWK